MCGAGDCKLQPMLHCFFEKQANASAMRTQDANQLRLLGRRWWLGNHRVKQGRPDIHSAASPDCRACRAGVGRVHAPSSQVGRVAQRKLSSPATGEKTRQLSISWRMCVRACVCVPRALTGLTGCQAMSFWKTVRKRVQTVGILCAANNLNVAQGTRI